MIENSQQLGAYLKSKAPELGVRLAFDTHYDANNWELSWWQGKVLNRLDFQPLEATQVAVTHHEDRFRVLPHFLRWAHNNIPLFPYLANLEWRRLTTESFPVAENRIDALVASAKGS